MTMGMQCSAKQLGWRRPDRIDTSSVKHGRCDEFIVLIDIGLSGGRVILL